MTTRASLPKTRKWKTMRVTHCLTKRRSSQGTPWSCRSVQRTESSPTLLFSSQLVRVVNNSTQDAEECPPRNAETKRDLFNLVLEPVILGDINPNFSGLIFLDCKL